MFSMDYRINLSIKKLRHKVLFCLLIVFLYHSSKNNVNAEETSIIWHITAISLSLASAGYENDQRLKYNELLEEDKSLKTDFENATTSAELVNLTEQHEKNKKDLEQLQNNINYARGAAIFGVLWESYLLIKGLSGAGVANSPHQSDSSSPQFVYLPDVKNQKFTFAMIWRF